MNEFQNKWQKAIAACIVLITTLVVWILFPDIFTTVASFTFLGAIVLYITWDGFHKALDSIPKCLGFLTLTVALDATIMGMLAPSVISVVTNENLDSTLNQWTSLLIAALVALSVMCAAYGLIARFAERKTAVVSMLIMTSLSVLVPAAVSAILQFTPSSSLQSYCAQIGSLYNTLSYEYDVRGLLSATIWFLTFPFWASSFFGTIILELRNQ